MYDDRRPAASRARQPIFTAPGVLLYLIGAFVFMFVALTFTPALTLGLFGPALELRPAQFVAGPAANDGVVLMIAPLVGHMFVHADLIHLGSNSVWLLAFGAPVFLCLGRTIVPVQRFGTA